MLTPEQRLQSITPTATVARSGPLVAARSTSSTSPGRLGGYVALWESLSGDLGGFREKISRGAFSRTLADAKAGQADVLAFVEHDSRAVLGRLVAKNFELVEDGNGLRFTLTLPDTQLARDTLTLVRSGVLRGCSFAFAVVRDSWDKESTGSVRTLKDIRLFECSIVSTPAYAKTSVSALRGQPNAAFWTAARLRAVAAVAHRSGLLIAQRRSVKNGVEWR
jgi:HK97 family phage prohead protease